MKQSKRKYLNDHELVDAILKGNGGAFAILIRQTEGLVAGMIYQLTGRQAEAKDLAQDIYLKVYKGLPGFRFGSKLSTWVGQITYHACLRWLQHRKMVYMDLSAEAGDLGFDEPMEEATVFGGELRVILAKAIDILPPLYRALITLYHTEELSYLEISEIMELPEGTVKSYLFRARRLLREHLIKQYKEDL